MYHRVKSVRILSFSGPNTGKYDPEKLRIPTLFTQWCLLNTSSLQIKMQHRLKEMIRFISRFKSLDQKFYNVNKNVLAVPCKQMLQK